MIWKAGKKIQAMMVWEADSIQHNGQSQRRIESVWNGKKENRAVGEGQRGEMRAMRLPY